MDRRDYIQGAWEAALQAGMTDAEFWAATPFQTATRIRVVSQQRMAQTWMAEALRRAKRLPSWDELMQRAGSVQRKKIEQAEMLSAIERLNVAWGGMDLRKKHG